MPPAIASSAIPSGLLPSMDAVLLEGVEDGSFTLVGQAPAWLRHLWPEALSQRKDLHPERTFLFLTHFLPEAEALWEGDEDASLTSEMWTEVDETGREWLLEASALRLERRSLLLLKFPTVSPENYREVLQQSRELSLEHYRLLKAIDRREVLMHCIVHDLSTPLAAIKGSLRLLLEDEIGDGDGASLVNIGLRQTDKMQQMMRELLTNFSAQTAPRQRSETVPDLAAAMRELITGLTPTATLKNVRFCLDTEPSDNAAWVVLAETNRLERVLFNLFENALRYAPTGSDIAIRLRDEGEVVCASVADAGTGVPKDQVPHLFRKFAQGSGKTGQVGLGLYYCRITIESWGGTIGYAPSTQGGACFWFRLPKPSADS